MIFETLNKCKSIYYAYHVTNLNSVIYMFLKICLCIFQFDTDGTGSIDFPEFLSLISKIQKEALEDKDELREAFTVFDKEGTGFLSKGSILDI